MASGSTRARDASATSRVADWFKKTPQEIQMDAKLMPYLPVSRHWCATGNGEMSSKQIRATIGIITDVTLGVARIKQCTSITAARCDAQLGVLNKMERALTERLAEQTHREEREERQKDIEKLRDAHSAMIKINRKCKRR